METCNYLLYLALILMCTKFLGLLTRRARMPQVVGALLAGLLLGPAVFKIIPQTEFLTQTAEVGVVILMFCAGMETDVKELKKCGKAATIIAVIGVLVPLAGGFATAVPDTNPLATAWFFNRPGMIESNVSTSLVLQNVFIGVILTATSVSITVETLKELGKLNSAAGNAILGAAVIDDILGIIALTVITSMADPTVKLWVVLVKIVGFFVFAAVAGFLFYKFFNYYSNRTKNGLQRYVIISFVFCLLMSYVAEEFFGVADITGAYVAGLVVSMIQKEDYLASRFSTLSYLYLSPIFFASIGLKVVIPQMSATIVWFAIVLTVVAILTKVVGCGLGARLCKYSGRESLQIGVGMISRGEVALIVASKGEALGLMSEQLMGPVVIVVIITTIVAPILLKPVFHDKKEIKEKA